MTTLWEKEMSYPKAQMSLFGGETKSRIFYWWKKCKELFFLFIEDLTFPNCEDQI